MGEEFRFTIDGTEVTIQAYKSDPNEDRLWVPFRDATSGDETYGAGQYLYLEREVHRGQRTEVQPVRHHAVIHHLAQYLPEHRSGIVLLAAFRQGRYTRTSLPRGR